MTSDSTVRLRPAIFCAVAILLIFGIVWSVRLARADSAFGQPNLADAERACRIAPEASAYWVRAAGLRELNRPDDPAVDAGISHALAVNPRSAEAWLVRAVRSETRGHIADAEHDYLEAARVDHMYKPAWALANFYVRQEQMDKFWFYARKCLEVVEPRRLEPVSYNPAPVFDLAWHVTSNPQEIRTRLIPPRQFVLVDYLEYLTGKDLLDPGADIAKDLLPYRDPADKEDLLNICHRLIYGGNGSRAVEIWNGLIDNRTLPYTKLDPQHGRSLTNGDFKLPFERVGFDWLLLPSDGIMESHFPADGEVRLQFNGEQPEGVMPLRQSVPVIPGTSYHLTFQYRTAEMEHAAGLAWQAWEIPGEAPIPVDSTLTPHEEWTSGQAGFTVPKGVSMIMLGLGYHRVGGTTRIQGTTAFRALDLAASPASTGKSK